MRMQVFISTRTITSIQLILAHRAISLIWIRVLRMWENQELSKVCRRHLIWTEAHIEFHSKENRLQSNKRLVSAEHLKDTTFTTLPMTNTFPKDTENSGSRHLRSFTISVDHCKPCNSQVSKVKINRKVTNIWLKSKRNIISPKRKINHQVEKELTIWWVGAVGLILCCLLLYSLWGWWCLSRSEGLMLIYGK